jgi:glutaredoxin
MLLSTLSKQLHFPCHTVQCTSMHTIHTLTLYSKPDCTLCVPVKYIINKLKHKYTFNYSEINIDLPEHSTAYNLYCHDIPVITCNGKEICRHRINEKQLVDALKQDDD